MIISGIFRDRDRPNGRKGQEDDVYEYVLLLKETVFVVLFLYDTVRLRKNCRKYDDILVG